MSNANKPHIRITLITNHSTIITKTNTTTRKGGAAGGAGAPAGAPGHMIMI